MIDFVKIRIKNTPPEHFIKNTLLDFGQTVKIKTGELTYPLTSKYRELKIEIKSQTFTEITGSLHKYFTGGHNYNDFNFQQVCSAITSLCKDLRLEPHNCHIANLEFGVNIILPFEPDSLLKRLISFKMGEQLSIMKNQTGKKIGCECYLSQYGVKFYNKKFQCELSEHVIRFEVKVRTMDFLRPIKTLADLLSFETYHQFQQLLIEIFDSVLIADRSINLNQLKKRDRELYTNGINPKFWENLHEKDRKQYSYYRQRFKELQVNYGTENYHSILRELIIQKSNSLLKSSDVLNNFSLPKIGRSEHSNSILKHPNLTPKGEGVKCKSCGRDISHQKPGSIFCSETKYGKQGKHCRNIDSNPRNNLVNKIKRIESRGVLFDVRPYFITKNEKTKLV